LASKLREPVDGRQNPNEESKSEMGHSRFTDRVADETDRPLIPL